MKKKNVVFVLISLGVLTLIFVGYFVYSAIAKNKGELQYMNSEEGIIQTFNDNYELFSEVARYIENEPGSFYFFKTNQELIVKIDSENIDLNYYPVGKQILIIVNELGYIGIVERDDHVTFTKCGGKEERGLMYAKEGTTTDEFDRGIIGKAALIKDNWYYYYFHHNN